MHSSPRKQNPELSSKQAILEARASYRPFDLMARRVLSQLEDDETPGPVSLQEIKIEVDQKAKINSSHKAQLLELAKVILGANVLSTRQAKEQKDVAWATAAFAHPEGYEHLDERDYFSVGVCREQRPRSVEECQAAARFFAFHEVPEGFTMLPDVEGNHWKVPLMGIILRPGLVEVARGGYTLGYTSIWQALVGFEPFQRERFQEPTPDERSAAEREKNRKALEDKAAEKAAAEKAAYEATKADFADLFGSVDAEFVEERKAAERERLQKEWVEFVNASPELVEMWGSLAARANRERAHEAALSDALMLLTRPQAPRREDLVEVLPIVRHHIGDHPERWSTLLAYVQDFPARKGWDMEKALLQADGAMPWLFPPLSFVRAEGRVVRLEPLKELSSYTRSEWFNRVSQEVSVTEEEAKILFSLAGEEG